jgi:hypothetical protein
MVLMHGSADINVAGSNPKVAGRKIIVGDFGGHTLLHHFPCLSQLSLCEWYVNYIEIALFLNERLHGEIVHKKSSLQVRKEKISISSS